jgi:ferredoxin
MPRVTFVTLDGLRLAVDCPTGSTILEAASASGVPMLGTCGGSMICATCHVKISAADRARLPAPSEDEEDTLDLAFGVTADSRLGCQVKLSDAMDGIDICLAPTAL